MIKSASRPLSALSALTAPRFNVACFDPVMQNPRSFHQAGHARCEQHCILVQKCRSLILRKAWRSSGPPIRLRQMKWFRQVPRLRRACLRHADPFKEGGRSMPLSILITRSERIAVLRTAWAE
jgi:hypothetical protein